MRDQEAVAAVDHTRRRARIGKADDEEAFRANPLFGVARVVLALDELLAGEAMTSGVHGGQVERAADAARRGPADPRCGRGSSARGVPQPSGRSGARWRRVRSPPRPQGPTERRTPSSDRRLGHSLPLGRPSGPDLEQVTGQLPLSRDQGFYPEHSVSHGGPYHGSALPSELRGQTAGQCIGSVFRQFR